jgi:hypothetical protein
MRARRSGLAWNMADEQVKKAHPNQPETSSALLHLGRAMVPAECLERTLADAANSMTAEVELTMADLVGDANGEIVLFNDSNVRRLVISSDAAVVADGQAGPHRTTGGDDVSGFSFVTFDNGLTLYYQDGLDLVIRAARR